MTTLDEFIETKCIRKLDFAKIDVEGHELEVLKGGSHICLRRLRPLFLMEVFPYVYKGHFDALCEHMASHSYAGFMLTEDGCGLQTLALTNADRNSGYNYFFIPSERLGRIAHLRRYN
jgi:hypothetical protein